MVFPAFASYDVTLQEDGGVTGIATARGYYLVHSRSIGKATATQEKSE